MKIIVILIGLVSLTTFGNVQADIAIIAPTYDSNCDAFFDHQSQIFDHNWDGDHPPNLLTIMAKYIKSYVSAHFRPTNEPIFEFDSSNENNLLCYAIPKVIETENKLYLHPIALLNKGSFDFQQEKPFYMKDNSSMCCFVPLQAQHQTRTV